MLNLVGRSDNKDPLRLTGEAMNEDDMLQEALDTNNLLLAQTIYLQKAILAQYFNDFRLAADMAGLIWDNLQLRAGSCNFMTGVTYFVLGLSAMGMARPCCKIRCRITARKARRHARKYIKKLSLWVKQGEPNVQHMLLILKAEQSHVGRNGANKDDHVRNVQKAYDTAISVSARSGFLQNAALANERAGLYFLEKQNDDDWAQLYIGRAYQLYSEWGAEAKLDQMRRIYPFLADSKDFLSARHGTQRYGKRRFSVSSKHFSSSTESFLEAENILQ